MFDQLFKKKVQTKIPGTPDIDDAKDEDTIEAPDADSALSNIDAALAKSQELRVQAKQESADLELMIKIKMDRALARTREREAEAERERTRNAAKGRSWCGCG